MKRGQMEILGFLVIVLLLLFALIFYFKFASQEPSTIITESEQNLEVSNMLNAIKYYTVTDGVSMKDVMKDCIGGDAEACVTVETEVPLIIEAYEFNNASYVLDIGDIVLVGACDPGYRDYFTLSGVEVGLKFCY
tara:strand:- start:71 stop:475 length:405 start_codon:yes stop_codon:yes gene_type:complete